MNKKIFFVADAKTIHTAKWVDYFVDKNYDVYIATFSKVNNTKCQNIFYLSENKINSKGKNYHYLFQILKLSKILKDIKPDIVNAHFSYSMGLISLLAIKISKIDTSFSVVCHGSDILTPPLPFIINRINKYLLKRCYKVFVVSDQIKDRVEEFGIDSQKIFVGQYGIELNNKNYYKDIDILSNRNYILNSRIDFLLDAIDKLNNKKLNIVFIVPKISNDNFLKIVKKYPYIKFYKEIEYSKMMNLISRTKIYISATLSDGTSLALLEALNYKTVPLVSNIVSNRSWVLDGINGYLFNNKIEFIQKLNKILLLSTKDLENIYQINNKLLLDKCNYRNQLKKIEKNLI